MSHPHDLQEEPESTLGAKPEELIEDERHRHEQEAARAHPPPPEPELPLRDWLRSVKLPSTRDDVVEAAEKNGAPKPALAFLRSLPEAIFESERGLEHVLTLVSDDDFPDDTLWESPQASEDGDSG